MMKSQDEDQPEDFDAILTLLKTGRWNVIYFIGVGLCGFLTASNVLGGAFLTPNVEYACHPPEEANVVKVSNCTYVANMSFENGHGFSMHTEECDAWYFDNSTFHSTVTSEFELVCDSNYLRATYQTVYMIGNFFGSPLNGIISDKLGRRKTVTVGSIVFIGCSILTAWMPTFSSLLALRFILGLMHPSVLQTGFILCMEVCEPKHRSTVGILISLPWALGTMWWGILGLLIRDWRWLQFAASLPGIIILIFLWFFDESPRWLIVRGQHKKAYRILEKAARLNKAKLPSKEKLMNMMKRSQNKSSDNKNVIEITTNQSKWAKTKRILLQTTVLFRTPTIRKRTLLMYVDFLVASTVFYGLSLNGKNFSADPHIYMILTGLMEVPAYSLTAPIVAKLGRRIPTTFCYALCGVTILILAFIPPEPTWLIICLAMVGKLCISAAYQIIYLISSEIFPTEVRLQGLGTSNLVARTGATSSPFITDLLGPRYPWAPSMLFGGASLAAAVATLFLPETLMKPLPETIDQLEAEALLNSPKRSPSSSDEESPHALTEIGNKI